MCHLFNACMWTKHLAVVSYRTRHFWLWIRLGWLFVHRLFSSVFGTLNRLSLTKWRLGFIEDNLLYLNLRRGQWVFHFLGIIVMHRLQWICQGSDQAQIRHQRISWSRVHLQTFCHFWWGSLSVWKLWWFSGNRHSYLVFQVFWAKSFHPGLRSPCQDPRDHRFHKPQDLSCWCSRPQQDCLSFCRQPAIPNWMTQGQSYCHKSQDTRWTLRMAWLSQLLESPWNLLWLVQSLSMLRPGSCGQPGTEWL